MRFWLGIQRWMKSVDFMNMSISTAFLKKIMMGVIFGDFEVLILLINLDNSANLSGLEAYILSSREPST